MLEKDDLTAEEKGELLALRQQKEELRESEVLNRMLAYLDLLPPAEKLPYYNQEIKSALAKLKGVEQEAAIKLAAKAIGVSVKAVRDEIMPRAAKEQLPRWFDDKGEFIPPILAKYLFDKHNFAYDRNMLYCYDGGYYRPNAFPLVKARCLTLLERHYRDAAGNEVGKFIETKLWRDTPVLDVDNRLINIENGLLSWIAGPPKLEEHTPDYMSSIQIPVRYDPDAKCPVIDQFFQDVLPPDCLDLAYELFGYCLIPNTSLQKVFMLVGSGANGKSKFLGLLQAFIGARNCAAESLQDLAENRFRVVNLVGKLINVFSDLPAKMLEDTGLFKALVSGDMISAERKGEQAFTFENHARLIFSANELPRTKDLSHGFFRRWVIIRFPNSFPEGSPKRDPGILAKLTTPEELSGLLNKAIEGLVRLFSQRAFSAPASVAAELDAYQMDNDNVRAFIGECCELRIGAKISKDQLYRSYEKWCGSGNYHPVSRTKFNKHIKNVFPTVREDTNGIRKWINIAEITYTEAE